MPNNESLSKYIYLSILVIVVIGGVIAGSHQLQIGPFEDKDDDGNSHHFEHESPVAVIIKNRTNVNPGEMISFDGSESYGIRSNITQYFWNFNDGITSQDVTTDHSWDSPGSYNVSLRVTDKDGNTNISWTPIGITYRENTSGNTHGEQYNYDFTMVEEAKMVFINTTLQNGDANLGDNEVIIRISFNNSIISEWHVELSGDRTEISIYMWHYKNFTNLTEGTWTWELEVVESGVICDIDWEFEAVIKYGWIS